MTPVSGAPPTAAGRLRTTAHIAARAALLGAVGAIAGLSVNALRGDGIALRTYAAPAACTAPPAALPSVEVLPPSTAVNLCADPGTLIADARPAHRFARGHVAGAVHLPCAASGHEAERAVAGVEGKHTLIVYGDSTDEARPVAEDLRRRLGGRGVRLVVIDGGFAAWDRAGLACSSGPCPDCTESRAR